MYKRKHGEEQPYWGMGPFQVRIPFVHYKLESAEFIQALVMFVVSLAMIPLIQQYLGLSYEVALAFVFVCGIGYLLPALLGTPFVPGWITPAIPIVGLFLTKFEPGPESIKALVALQLLVFAIFFVLGITRLGSKLVNGIPNSIKGGILIGAGVAALIGEINGRLANTPISIIIGSILTFYFMFSLSFKKLREKNGLAKKIANYGMVPATLVAIAIGWIVSEYKVPDIKWGITIPAFDEMWNHLPFTIGFPTFEMFLLAIPTAIIAYIIAYGDIIVGNALINRSDNIRNDEKIDNDIDRVHLITAIRNLIHSLFAPYPGLSGPIWTGVTATVAERYTYGRKAMDSIYGGAGTFWIAGFLALFILPLVTLFQPVLPIALSLTLIITGYICIQIGIEQVQTSTERGVAGIVAVVLATHGAAYGLAIGVVLYFLIERTSKKVKKEPLQEIKNAG
jgi:NADH:ubiquinone oxidoreductase subunit K